MLAEARALATLARWLGPWTPAGSSPRTPQVDAVDIDAGDRRFRAWLFGPRTRAVGRYVLAPGLHFDGPADPRMQRFCAILAAAGFEVLVPFLPDFTALRVTPRVIDDFAATFAWLAERRAGSLGLFSISFGSLPALRLAASRRWADRVSHAVCFGGYADFSGAMEYALSGDRRDPLNQAAVFINLIDAIDGASDPDTLVDAWLRYMRRTWGRPEMKARDRWEPIAREIAGELPAPIRQLFLVGCGAEPGSLELARAAFARRAGDVAFVDPRPHLGSVGCKVFLVHGRDDDVIPHQHAAMLAAALPPSARAEVLLTGLYDHTRPAGEGTAVDKARLVAAEGATMLKILRAIALGRG